MFLFSEHSRLALLTSQLPSQWVLGCKDRGVRVITHLNQMSRFRMSGSVLSRPAILITPSDNLILSKM
jgi:hypothetical protein